MERDPAVSRIVGFTQAAIERPTKMITRLLDQDIAGLQVVDGQ